MKYHQDIRYRCEKYESFGPRELEHGSHFIVTREDGIHICSRCGDESKVTEKCAVTCADCGQCQLCKQAADEKPSLIKKPTPAQMKKAIPYSSDLLDLLLKPNA